MKLKNKTKSILSAFLAVCMLLSISPVTTFAAQSNEYVDPADNWLSSNNRTNELDVNATTTYSMILRTTSILNSTEKTRQRNERLLWLIVLF